MQAKSGPQTCLKYAVELKIPRCTRMLGILEPLMERVVYEDVPLNLAALKARVESLKGEQLLASLQDQGATD